MISLAVVVAAYLIGGIPFGYLLVKLTTGADVRSAGSGNIGATNVMRTTGRTAGILTLLLDGGKGYFAVWLAGRLTEGNALWMSAAALAVMIGHAYPVYLRFKGGKAVASCVGAFLCLAPAAMVAVLVVFVATVAWTRHISMGSIIAAATLPLAIWIIDRGPLSATVAAAAAAALVIYRHHGNIARLRAGTENVFTFGARK